MDLKAITDFFHKVDLTCFFMIAQECQRTSTIKPTLAIWTDNKKFCYNDINDEFIEKYELLKESGILFDDLDELKIHIEKYWYNVDDWFSQKTQNCIKKFNKDFNNKINLYSLFTLRKIINENI